MNVIHLLPEVVSNQIAAGEVVQRPASAVKELLENAIDAGATKIQLIIKDAGRTLIQVVDNGKGMNFSDARMCFERHATSKITSSDDLFHLTTKGFRGEALASIAAIAQVEMVTKRDDQETGTILIIEGSEIKEHAPTAAANGTSISVKNLFFNVPARRNFLKSDAIEFGHIEEELNRLSLLHYNVEFVFYNNGIAVQTLSQSNQKQRIANVLGSHIKDKLFPVEMDTDTVKIKGFIAKPENAKKKKNDQYLFVNQRFIKHYLLTHAIETAYSSLIPEGHKPAFFLEIEVPPQTIDINISPTKIDIKFQDERLIYGFLHAAIKKTLGTLSLIPQIDFETNPSYDFSDIKPKEYVKPPTLTLNPNYNPFANPSELRNSPTDAWAQFLEGIKKEKVETLQTETQTACFFADNNCNQSFSVETNLQIILFHNEFLIFQLETCLAFVELSGARERILYEQYKFALENQPAVIQQSLFPETITLSAAPAEIILDIKNELRLLGYDLEQMDRNTFAVNGTPLGETTDNVQETMEQFAEMYKTQQFLHKTDKQSAIALSMAKQRKHYRLTVLTVEEQHSFLKALFQCPSLQTSPSGKKIVHFITKDDLYVQFAKH